MNDILGNVWCFGDHVNTDIIHPPEFFSLDPAIVRKGLFHKYDATIQSRFRANDIIVAGRNFGCGSSREASIQSLLLNGIGAIIAIDFARIFFRSATNNGIPCLTFANPLDFESISSGSVACISLKDWTFKQSGDKVLQLTPQSAFIRMIWEAGGLLNTIEAKETLV